MRRFVLEKCDIVLVGVRFESVTLRDERVRKRADIVADPGPSDPLSDRVRLERVRLRDGVQFEHTTHADMPLNSVREPRGHLRHAPPAGSSLMLFFEQLKQK